MPSIVTGLLTNVLNLLTTLIALVNGLPGANAAVLALNNAVSSVLQAIGILNALPPIP